MFSRKLRQRSRSRKAPVREREVFSNPSVIDTARVKKLTPAGLTIATTQQEPRFNPYDRPIVEAPSKRRSLDDMRKLSDEIKRRKLS